MRRLFQALPVLLAIAVTAACGAQSVPEQSASIIATPQPTAETGVAMQAPMAAATSAPSEPAAPADWLNTATVDGDYFVLGNPAAPVRLTDYSDFL